ncbi:MAG: ThuA domain-containing protein, partial [Verrucomicrobiota bacterium]
ETTRSQLITNMKYLASLILAAVFTQAAFAAETLVLAGKDGPGKGKKIVLVSGDEEYRSEEALPMLAKILSQKHGFDCEVLFAWDSTGTYLDSNNQQGVRGWSALKDADLMIIATRFRKPSDEDAVHVTDFMNAGKPVIGLRTATHAFNGGQKFGGTIGFGEWGRKILGEQWVSHHGGHKREGARGVIEEENKDHPILNGIEDVFGPSDVYGVKHLTDADTVLMRGAVTKTLDPKSELVAEKNDPMQALAWLHPYTAPNGEAKGTSFCTTMGASVDLLSEDLRRLVVNAAYHLTGLEVPAAADVDYVDPYYPSFYGFIREEGYFKNLNMKPEDYGLGKTPMVPDPKGTPDWPFNNKRPE